MKGNIIQKMQTECNEQRLQDLCQNFQRKIIDKRQPVKKIILRYKSTQYIIYTKMGLSVSEQQKALIQAGKIKSNLYARVQNTKKNNVAAFNEIDRQLKRKIIASSARQIADMIDNREATSLQVVYTFIQKTINTGIANNYVFDEMFEEAIAEAFICDQQRARDQYGKKCWRPGMNKSECYPPFYGVPTSLKENLIVKGRQVHVGFVAKVNPLSDHDGLFMMMVRKMGFIPIARSNVPPACKTMQTNNNIFGYSKNPWNVTRTCGGSSGGQSGMVASNCVPIGFGTDIGGSTRVPAVFTGLVALKPHNRYSKMGNCYYGKFTGGIPYKSQLGPITKTVEDTILVNQFLCDPQNYTDIAPQFQDPYMKYVPLNMQLINTPQKFRIGYMKRLKYAKCSKTNERAVDRAIEILRGKGHQVFQVNFEMLEKLYFIFINLFMFDQNLHIFSQFRKGEPMIPEYKLMTILMKIPWLIRRIIAWLIKRKYPRVAQIIKASRPLTGVQAFQKIFDVQKILCPKVYRVFAQHKLDALLLPTFASPAPKLGKVNKSQYFFSYTVVWNVLHYPAGTVPVTVVRAGQTQFEDEYNDMFTASVRDTMANAEGLPVGIQVASTPYNQEKILYIMKELEGEIKFRENHHIPQ